MDKDNDIRNEIACLRADQRKAQAEHKRMQTNYEKAIRRLKVDLEVHRQFGASSHLHRKMDQKHVDDGNASGNESASHEDSTEDDHITYDDDESISNGHSTSNDDVTSSDFCISSDCKTSQPGGSTVIMRSESELAWSVYMQLNIELEASMRFVRMIKDETATLQSTYTEFQPRIPDLENLPCLKAILSFENDKDDRNDEPAQTAAHQYMQAIDSRYKHDTDFGNDFIKADVAFKLLDRLFFKYGQRLERCAAALEPWHKEL